MDEHDAETTLAGTIPDPLSPQPDLRHSQVIGPTLDSNPVVPASSPLGQAGDDDEIRGSRGGDVTALQKQEEIDRAQHREHFDRLFKGIGIGAILYPSFFVADLLVDWYVQPGVLLPLVSIRLATTLLILLGLLLLRRYGRDSPAFTRVTHISMFVMTASTLALMCVFFGGFDSNYFVAICLVVICRGPFVEETWHEQILPLALMFFCPAVILFGSALFVDQMAAQLADPAVMSVYAINTCFLASTCLLTGFGSNLLWVLRRQVFESRSIGRFQLKSRLGAGGMGEVWEGYDRTLRQKVAIKILRPETGSGKTPVARFEREVRATSQLTHPNTVRVLDYGVTDDGLWYYAMELLDGADLGAVLAAEGRIPPERAVRLILQAARALAEAHCAGIVHRDIKPENLFVARVGGEEDFLKVLDFGIAKLTRKTDETTLTATGAWAGTPAYISPEAVLGKPIDARSDIYSLGAVLYTCVTGVAPFDGESVSSLLIQHISGTPRPPSELCEELPQELERIILRCLEKQPENRFADGAALARALSLVKIGG